MGTDNLDFSANPHSVGQSANHVRGVPAWRRLASLLVVLSVLLPLGLAADTVRVATYNLNNYLSMDRMASGHWREDYPKPEDEKTALRACIRAANADVLAVQEVGGPAYLEELQRDLKAEGLDYPHTAILMGPDEERRVAVLSRLPFARVITHDRLAFTLGGEREAVRRGLLEVGFETDGVPWTLFVVHLKSRWTVRDDDPQAASQRAAEAQAARDRIRAAFPDPQTDNYLVTGDFNDARDSSALRRFLRVGDRELAQFVEAVDSRGEAWTFHYRKRDLYERVDFLLASPALAQRIVLGSARVIDLLPDSLTASDHRPVCVELAF
ncbi:MAG: endonuclease/exonuclease/phosphatase family protein [Verrucomicrobiota bacterium JB024]|nr:endonuclease/exonuclease/phosphatase family protein [Verrucomicrobiota bacterium JB024]